MSPTKTEKKVPKAEEHLQRERKYRKRVEKLVKRTEKENDESDSRKTVHFQLKIKKYSKIFEFIRTNSRG